MKEGSEGQREEREREKESKGERRTQSMIYNKMRRVK